jgi:hypothetical protein
MKLVRTAAMLALMLAATVAARPAASASRPPRAGLQVAARALHTDASGARSSRAHGHSGHRHAHHHRARTNAAARLASSTAPAPLQPMKPGPDHRAALPRIGGGAHGQGGTRAAGSIHAALAGRTAPLILAGAAHTPRGDDSNVPSGGSIHSGRGPPLGASLTTLPPLRARRAAPNFPLRASTPRESDPSELSEPPDHARMRATVARCSVIRLNHERIIRRSHACRPEGAAGCDLMPSIGGLT